MLLPTCINNRVGRCAAASSPVYVFRLKNSDVITEEVSRLVRLNPTTVMHIPQALQYLVRTDTILNDSPEVYYYFVVRSSHTEWFVADGVSLIKMNVRSWFTC